MGGNTVGGPLNSREMGRILKYPVSYQTQLTHLLLILSLILSKASESWCFQRLLKCYFMMRPEAQEASK